MCNTDPIKTQTILWKTGFTKGRSYEWDCKRRKLRRWICLCTSCTRMNTEF
jgi:hypothetical protein